MSVVQCSQARRKVTNRQAMDDITERTGIHFLSLWMLNVCCKSWLFLFYAPCVYVCIGVAIISRGVFIEPGKKPQPGERKLYGPCTYLLTYTVHICIFLTYVLSYVLFLHCALTVSYKYCPVYTDIWSSKVLRKCPCGKLEWRFSAHWTKKPLE